MISNPSKYAIKSLVYIISNSSEGKKLSGKNIAEAVNVPKPYLSKILQLLSTKNYVSSTKGPGGGFYVTDKQLDNSIYDVIVETEGKDKLALCLLSFENCNTDNPCPVHDIIAPQKNALRDTFKHIRLRDLRDRDISQL